LTAVSRERGPVGMGRRGRSGECAAAVVAPGGDVILVGDRQIVAAAAARLDGARDDRAAGQLDDLASC
jgi:hypothetical protein